MPTIDTWGAYLAWDLSARFGRDRGWLLGFEQLLLAPLAGRFYRGPYDGVLADVQGAVFRHPLGTLVYWCSIENFEANGKGHLR
jgi:hypothetical protein